MRYDPDTHRRRSVRLPGHGYTRPGAYFVTICTRERECVLGDIVRGVMRLNEWGCVVREEWLRTAQLRPYVRLDRFIVMPNHFHGIVMLTGECGVRGTARRAPTYAATFGRPVARSLPTIVRSFKSACTRRMNQLRDTCDSPVWQRGYYDHVIRSDREMHAVRRYVRNNPANWARDSENPHVILADTL